ncbi:MAG: redoxin domain-containing protein [Bacteroidales bacterium]|nr:redoxin domain-containing protein [Bacteroidales bacterium]
MRRFLIIILVLALSVLDVAAQVDSTRLAELDSRLEMYFSALEAEPAEVKIEECDALIGSATDSLLRQRIALKMYSHYFNSPLMGDETVAIHLTDKWFSPGKIRMANETDLLEAKLFAMFNRQSLIGMAAPEVTLYDPSGSPVTIPVILSEAKDLNPRFSILYFYDTDCAKCKIESPMLRSLLDDKDYPVDVFAVYVGREEDKWSFWRESTFRVKAPSTNVIHLWDPDDSSDFQMRYGVTSTPKMFLVDPSGVIIGRNLDTDSLEKLMDARLAALRYDYGGEEAFALLDKLFSTYGVKVSPEDVMEVASMLESRTLARGDTVSFKHLEGDLLYYLAAKRGEGYKEGTSLFIKDYILSRPQVWRTPEDSLRVVGMASMLESMISKAPVGSVIPKTSIKGWNKLRRKGGFFLFTTPGCPVCATETAAAEYMRLAYLKVDMTALERESPELARELLDFFDLSSLPHIIQTGRRGVIKRRYLSLSEHLLFLREKE